MALYNEMCLMLKEIDDAKLQPSSATVLNILNYSRSTQAKSR